MSHPNLRELPIWLCWKKGEFNPRTGKHEKLPFNPVTGEFAECNDPSTWCTHAEAKAAFAAGKYAGLGIALSEDLGLIIVDFDGCRDPQSGQIEEWALREIRAAESFTEISSSGTGIHILAWGKLACNYGANAECRAEIYDHSKMFWLTGTIFEDYRAIQTRDLSDLHKRIGERAVGPKRAVTPGAPKPLIARGPASREKLMEGGWEEDYNNDHSAADLALCNLLARETDGDAEKIDVLFRTSCLYRDKWERDDYRDRTIAKAIAAMEAWRAQNPAAGPAPTVTMQEITENPPESSQEITYPLDIWANTEYAEFVEICRNGNFIPPEFFIEAIKTVTGAVVANHLSAPALEGGIPRFYTVLMTAGGGGKGTAIKYACSVFRDKWSEIAPLLWSPAQKIEEVPWVNLGACVSAFSSAPGMQRTLEKGHIRWLQIHEELSSIIESTGVEGSGQGLLAANRQLYDGEHFTTTATAKRDACAGQAQNSILAATTPELWEDMFSGKRVEGSGLFQRFNLIAADQPQRVGTLLTPNLADFSSRLIDRVTELQETPCRLAVGREGLECMNEWFAKLAAPGSDGAEPDPDEYGRLNVLAWRNAIHLAWLKRQDTILLTDVEAAIRLSDYQLAVRKKHKPAPGETRYALLEGKITKLVKERGRIKEREAYRKLNANRYGLGVWNGALKNIVTAGWINYAEDKINETQSVKWLSAKPIDAVQ